MPDGPVRCALVTGGTGFIGRHLVDLLLAGGWEVHSLVRPSSGPLPSTVHRHVDDGSRTALEEAIIRAEPSVCFHLAARVLASHQPDDVTRLATDNILFGARVAEALSTRPGTLIINAGTYAQHVGGVPYRPATLYAATKQASEDVLRFYADAALLRVVTLKLSTIYGAGDGDAKLLSVLLDAAATSRAVDTSGGDQLLDLLHVDDAARAFLIAAERFIAAPMPLFESYAVAFGAHISVLALAAKIESVTGRRIDARWGTLPYRRHEQFEPWFTGVSLPGWSPVVLLDEGLRRTWKSMNGSD